MQSRDLDRGSLILEKILGLMDRRYLTLPCAHALTLAPPLQTIAPARTTATQTKPEASRKKPCEERAQRDGNNRPERAAITLPVDEQLERDADEAAQTSLDRQHEVEVHARIRVERAIRDAQPDEVARHA